MRALLVALFLSIVAASLFACSSAGPTTEAEPVQTSSRQSEDEPRSGRQIFAATCAACHGADGEGVKNWMVRDEDGRLPPPPLNGEGHTWHHSDGVLYGIVSEGGLGLGFGSNMPAFQDELTREEIITVLEYVKTLWEGKEIDGISLLEAQQEFSDTDPYPPAASQGG